MSNEFLKKFIEECKYYDLKNKELKAILRNINFKSKKVLDIGTGIGRLAFPILEYAKEVTAIDKDVRLKEHFKRHKRENFNFINKSLENYSKSIRNFDIIIIAWPTFDPTLIRLVKKFCKDKTKIIFISCYNNSDFETIPNKLGHKSPKEDILKKRRFIRELIKNFKLVIKKQVNTEYIYPNEKIAFRVIKNCLNLWYDIKLKDKDEEKLKDLIRKHKKLNKIKFKEKLYFYVLKCKS